MRRFRSGDAVYARVRGGKSGTFAERITVNEVDRAHKQSSLSMEEAELFVYRDPGHGGIFQYHDAFLEKPRTFLAARAVDTEIRKWTT